MCLPTFKCYHWRPYVASLSKIGRESKVSPFKSMTCILFSIIYPPRVNLSSTLFIVFVGSEALSACYIVFSNRIKNTCINILLKNWKSGSLYVLLLPIPKSFGPYSFVKAKETIGLYYLHPSLCPISVLELFPLRLWEFITNVQCSFRVANYRSS